MRYPYPVIRFTKNGSFFLNNVAIDSLHLQDGERISFVNDKKNTRDWYILRDPDGVPIKLKKSAAKGCYMKVRNILGRQLNVPKNEGFRLRIASEPSLDNGMSMYAILTSKLV